MRRFRLRLRLHIMVLKRKKILSDWLLFGQKYLFNAMLLFLFLCCYCSYKLLLFFVGFFSPVKVLYEYNSITTISECTTRQILKQNTINIYKT